MFFWIYTFWYGCTFFIKFKLNNKNIREVDLIVENIVFILKTCATCMNFKIEVIKFNKNKLTRNNNCLVFFTHLIIYFFKNHTEFFFKNKTTLQRF